MAKIQTLFYNIHIIEGMGYRDSHLLGEEIPSSQYNMVGEAVWHCLLSQAFHVNNFFFLFFLLLILLVLLFICLSYYTSSNFFLSLPFALQVG